MANGVLAPQGQFEPDVEFGLLKLSMASSANKAVAATWAALLLHCHSLTVLKSKLLARDIVISHNRGSRFGRNPPFLKRFSIVSLSGRLQDLE